jgi:hypothetical protein
LLAAGNNAVLLVLDLVAILEVPARFVVDASSIAAALAGFFNQDIWTTLRVGGGGK